MKKYLVYFIILFFAVSCEDTDNDTKKCSWEKHSYFGENQFDSYATNDFIYFVSQEMFYSIALEKETQPISNSYIKDYRNIHKQKWDIHVPFCNDFHISYGYKNDSTLFFVPNSNPKSFNSFKLKIKDIDKDFYCLDTPDFYFGNGAAINNKNQALITYRTKDWKEKAILVDITINKHSFVDTLKTKIINIPDEKITYSVNSIGSDFYIGNENATYLVKSTGEIKKVYDNKAFLRVIEENGILYSLAFEDCFMSTNNGNTWTQLQNSMPYSFVNNLTYRKIGDKIVAFGEREIHEISFNKKFPVAIELDIDGLENSITSVSKFKDKVYVTTLDGVYCRSYDEFFTPKYKKTK